MYNTLLQLQNLCGGKQHHLFSLSLKSPASDLSTSGMKAAPRHKTEQNYSGIAHAQNQRSWPNLSPLHVTINEASNHETNIGSSCVCVCVRMCQNRPKDKKKKQSYAQLVEN